MTDTPAANSLSPNNNTYLPRLYAALPFLALFLFMLVVNWNAAYYPDNDDAYFLEMAQGNDFIEYMSFRYMNWSGRLFAEVLHYGVFSAPLILWKFLNSGMVVLLAFSMSVLLFGWRFWNRIDRSTLLTLWFLCLALGWIIHPVLVAAVFWVTGSLDYLWPLALAVFALIPFIQRLFFTEDRGGTLPVWLYILSGLAGICACLGVEQASALLLGAGILSVLYLFYRERRLDLPLAGLLLVFLLASLVSASSPGNVARY